MSQIFSPQIITKTPSRNKFNLSYYSRITTRMGDLVPVMCKKIIAGDRWRVGISSITRLAPLANPVYDRVRITYDAFFVQNRIIDPDFKDFISPDPEKTNNPNKDITLTLPIYSGTGTSQSRLFCRGGLMDFLGYQFASYDSDGSPYLGAPIVPPGGSSAIAKETTFNIAPLFGYAKIFDAWYRNERFQKSVYNQLIDYYDKSARTCNFSFSDGIWPSNDYGFFCVNYGKDLYTTALETAMIGGPVNIPSGNSLLDVQSQISNETELDDLNTKVAGNVVSLQTGSGANEGSGKLVVDMKNAVLGTIQELKFAYALFAFYMKDTYNGNRYVEFMQAHYGQTVPDATLDRPLFLGRITQWLDFTEIYQTSGATNGDNALGDYAGIGSGSGSGFLFDCNFLENGYLYILMAIRPNSTYFQGVDRKWFYGDRFDSFFFPEFQNIGDKPIFTKELFYGVRQGGTLPTDYFDLSWQKINDGTIFGYNRANAEYIWFHDEMHGNFLNDNSEKNWTFARTFSSEPVLGETFSKVPAIQNPFTFTDDESLNYYTDILFDIKALRPINRYERY